MIHENQYEDLKNLLLMKEAEIKKLQKKISVLEDAIKKHRDEKGHDRCWLSDQDLYSVLRDGKEADQSLPDKEEFLRNCEAYYELRRK